VDASSPADPGSLAALEVQGCAIGAGSGQLGALPEHDRLTVLDVGGPCPIPLWDGPVPRVARADVLADLRRRAASFREVELDTMVATPWALAWTIDPGPFVLWDEDGVRLRVAGATIARRDGPDVATATVGSVVAALSPDWFTRSVELVPLVGEPVVAARTDEPMARIDPTYDYICLTFDASWAVQLARALASAVGVPADCTAYD